jgi:hypothetical protein
LKRSSRARSDSAILSFWEHLMLETTPTDSDSDQTTPSSEWCLNAENDSER